MMPDLYGPGPPNVRRTAYFALRSSRAGTQTFINEMRQAVWSVNSTLAVASISTMQDIYGQSMARTSFTLVMLAIAGTMAVALVAAAALASYLPARRTAAVDPVETLRAE